MAASSSSYGGLPPYCNPRDAVDPGASVSATVRIGDNSAADGGTPELLLGGGSDSTGSAGQTRWDDNLADGLDSDWVSVSLTVQAHGPLSAQWEAAPPDPPGVGSSVSLSFSGPTTGYIKQVLVRSKAVGADVSAEWSSVAVRFYAEDGTPDGKTVSDECLPPADTYGGGPNATASRIEAATSRINAVKVVITGLVRLRWGGSQLPGADAAVCEVHVYTDPF